MAENPADTIVLVTGASGFIALHCIRELLERGYRVRGTLRSPSRAEAVRRTMAKHVDPGDRLEFATADLSSDAGWADAARGCRYVLHVASPLPRSVPKHEDELVVPAREGTIRVLRASVEAGVARVVLTSSLAAVVYGHARDGSRTYDESDWSLPEKPIGAYEKSKTLAERAGWQFVESLPAGRRIELVTINPGIVLGPILDEDSGTSAELVRKLLVREFPGLPNLGWAPVDVRDVAWAHVEAMIRPEAAGKRYCCAIEHAWMRDVAAVLRRHFEPKGFKIPTIGLPNVAVRLFALFDPETRVVVNDLGLRQDVSTKRIRRDLDWKPRSLEEMVVATAESLIEQGVVRVPGAR